MKELIAIIIWTVGIAGWSGPSPDEMRAEIYDYGYHMETCTPYEQVTKAYGESFTRAIVGISDGKCEIFEEFAGPQMMRCAIPEADLPKFAAAYTRQAEMISDDGSVKFKYDSSETDTWNALINTPACEFVDKE
ncbi:MAG: hypothetical protein AAF557_18460 [Pseudomonadota bacterium]